MIGDSDPTYLVEQKKVWLEGALLIARQLCDASTICFQGLEQENRDAFFCTLVMNDVAIRPWTHRLMEVLSRILPHAGPLTATAALLHPARNKNFQATAIDKRYGDENRKSMASSSTSS